MTKIIIGITSKNRKSILPKAIQSALDQDFKDKAIVIFDDASIDGTLELAKNFPTCQWILSSESKGYVYARNLFLTIGNPEYFCSLDDDAWFLNSSTISQAILHLDKNPNIAALAFEILSPDDKEDKVSTSVFTDTNLYIGCGHILRVSKAIEVGKYLPVPGFYGGEEKDLCIRLIDRGYHIVKANHLKVWHDKTTLARDLPRQHRSGVCNDLVFMWRRTPLLLLLPALLSKLLKHIRFSFMYKKADLRKAGLLGITDFFKFLFSFNIGREAVSYRGFKQYIAFNKK